MPIALSNGKILSQILTVYIYICIMYLYRYRFEINYRCLHRVFPVYEIAPKRSPKYSANRVIGFS